MVGRVKTATATIATSTTAQRTLFDFLDYGMTPARRHPHPEWCEGVAIVRTRRMRPSYESLAARVSA